MSPFSGPPDRWRPALGRLASRQRANVLGVGLAVLAVAWLYVSGAIDVDENTLQVMGFDPDRAVLITALLSGAVAAAVVALVGGRLAVGVATGALTSLAGFATVFRHETEAALRARGADGSFDPVGWIVTVVTIVVVATVVAWAATILGADVRVRAIAAAHSSIRFARERAPRDLRAVVAAIAVVALLFVSLPVFGDMVNFEPDSRMYRGAPAPVGLFGDVGSATGANGSVATGGASGALPGSDGSGGPAATGTASGGGTGNGQTTSTRAQPLVVPSDLVAGPVSGSFVTAGTLSMSRPWAAHPPAGGGRTFSVQLPAPWVGGIQNYTTIDVYLPPGYDQSSARYPVIYEPHQPLWAWQQGMHLTSLLDELMRSGVIPPEIVVFVGQFGGPYPDSECADSWDGKEWFDRFLGNDVPAWVDSHLRTIATPAARSLLGFSSGGYCAAAAIAHHPGTFDSSIVFSGYFVAGIRSSTTPIAWRPFNGDPALEAKVSPIDVVPQLPASDRSTMFFGFSADPANTFYGAQITQFAKVLDAAGVGMAILPTPLGHSWTAVREQLPTMLAILAARQAKLGVFG